jgi:hypothetical protein
MEPNDHPPYHLPVLTPHFPIGVHDMGRKRSRKGGANRRDDNATLHFEAVRMRRMDLCARNPWALAESDSTLRTSQQRLFVHRGVEADPRPESNTPSELPDDQLDEIDRLERVSRFLPTRISSL